MPDCVTFDLLVEHPRSAVWEVIGTPELYPRFFRGVGSCERISPDARASRYRARLSVCGPPTDHDLRVLLSRPGEQLVLDSEPDTAGCVSIQLDDVGEQATMLRFIFFRPPGRSKTSANDIRGWIRDAMDRIGRHLSEKPEALPSERAQTTLQVAGVLTSAGIIAPARPDRVFKQIRAVSQWGATLAGGYTAAAAREPRGTAVIDDDGSVTFADLAERANRLAASLREMGAGEEGKVAVISRNNAGLVQLMLACGLLGADLLLLNIGLAEHQVLEAVQRHGARVVVADAEFAHLIGELPGCLTMDEAEELIEHTPGTRIAPPDRPGRIVVLTSGTTGSPRGAKRPTPKGLGAAVALLSRIPLRTGERMLIAAPLFHAWGLSALQVGMPLRATLVLQRRFDPEDCLRAIEEHQVTSLFLVPVMVQRIMSLPVEIREKYDTSSLRIVASSGAALPAALVNDFMDFFGDVLYNFYGSTEVSAAAIATPADLRAAPATAGYPPLGTRLAVLGPSGEPLPPGTVGWIHVGNDLLFDGYTDGSNRTMRHELMETGDRGYFDADGRLFVSGRDDDMIISGGENVFPRPVEEALATLPGVLDAAVVGVPDDEYGQRLVAFVVPHPRAVLDEDLVRSYLRQRVARFALPREVLFLSELPRTQTGKVLKRVLLEELA
ncbi:AMP-binding protein [Amycolatopsis sp. K13G38]|uniref:AMP-binding protein n=1 Tax=Amycolatopsis acididurans TaxID=2724524 RepID=A0ABX1JL94_9PSEU|nr:AMP-binding protein [Amycolatopsis acididurans]NKQ59290.1 AMP-binding protein [Amycolatopsis acididurans]